MTLVLLTLLSQWADFPGSAPSSKPEKQSKQDSYTRATQLIAARQFGEATAILNELAPANPKWAELYAARCSAQLGLQRAETAAADCRYAIGIKPTLYVALYGLATAEEQLGQSAPAAQHYREYAAARGPGVDPSLQTLAAQKAQNVALPPPPPPAPSGAAQVEPAPQVNSSPINVVVVAGALPLAPHHRRSRYVAAPRRADYADTCSSSLDCGPGGWCKDRGDGLHVCMNSGGHGDYCSSSIDCGPGGWCKDRGDGVRVCMSHGNVGEYCSSSIDCGHGLWCRERGDGTSVCMR